MKKPLLFSLLIILLCTTASYSQISFEKAYFIDNSGKKIDCFILNKDWRYNPKEFEYRLYEDGENKTASIESVQEFAIINGSKYIRTTVKMDRSSNSPTEMSYEQGPVYNEETLFLKVLVEGNASLYSYNEINLIRYFYNLDDLPIRQLIYKKYKTQDKTSIDTRKNKVAVNNWFRQQLLSSLTCETIKQSTIANLHYYQGELRKVFVKYNLCKNPEYIEKKEKVKRDLFNFSIRPGINSSSLDVVGLSIFNSRNTEFDNKITFRIGAEFEFIPPFNKDKWSIFAEPTYQYYQSSQTNETDDVSGGNLLAEVDYSSIELPVGIRHYFFLNSTSKIFLDVSYIFDFNSKVSLTYKRADGTPYDEYESWGSYNFGFGMGYKYNDRYSIEFRYLSPRDLNYANPTLGSEYSTISMILGITLL